MWTFVRRLALLAAFFCAFSVRAQTIDGVVDGDDQEGIGQTLATVFSENFEGGIGSWSADNGVWEVGAPTSGPNACHQGSQCAATVLGGDYPSDTTSRLISPTIVLPAVTSSRQEIQLRFWSWYQYGGCDGRLVQISVRDANGNWSAWATLNSASQLASTWSLMGVDLTAYAAQTIRIALLHTANAAGGNCVTSGAGWYVDEFSVRVRRVRLGGLFDRGWGDWATDNGIWQVGRPVAGPQRCHDGTGCASVVLDGAYPDFALSRLVSPTFVVPQLRPEQEAQLRFWQWIDYSSCDAGYVQLSKRNPTTGAWSAWANLDSAVFYSSPWSLRGVDLTPHAGSAVRIGFLHASDASGGNCVTSAFGWTIDTVQLAVFTPAFDTGFELGWNGWWADNGVWQVGTPSSGPGGCFGGVQCAGTLLDADYPPYSSSRLVSPPIDLPPATPGQEIEVRFMHWFAYGGCDAGYVQVSTRDAATGAWSAWANVGAPTLGASPAWTLKAAVVTPYAGATVRIAFLHTAVASGGSCVPSGPGWFIDDVRIAVQ
jgi:hypothetical protein